jgi:hypothetical protein
MIINNFTELVNFLNANNLGNLAGRLNQCMREYAVLCTCKPDQKKTKAQECDRLYSETIQLVMSNRPAVFSSCREGSLEFRKNGQVVSTITR